MNPFEIKTAIDQKKPLEWNEQLKTDYAPYIINKAFSFNMATILFANEMNLNASIPKKWQFDFLFYGIPKGKRFDKWIKADAVNDDENIKIIQSYFNINRNRALEFSTILTSEQIDIIKSKQEKGGRHARNID